MKMSLVESSQNHEWATPHKWFEYLNLEFGFTLDPCCTKETATCSKYFTPEQDGLKQSWAEERVFMNPPYGRQITQWMRKAYLSCIQDNALVVCLVPARVETQWWHNYAAKGEVRFPVGRLQFNDCGINAPFPAAIVIFRPKVDHYF